MKEIKNLDEDCYSEPYELLIIAIYKQAVNDLVSPGCPKQERETARIFLESTETGRKCLHQMEKEGLL